MLFNNFKVEMLCLLWICAVIAVIPNELPCLDKVMACQDLLIPLKVHFTNRVIYDTQLNDTSEVNALLLSLSEQANSSTQVNLTTSINISAKYCQPISPVLRRSTVQLLVSGFTYTKTYWAALGLEGLEAAQYSWVEFAAASGYSTLAIDRAGNGESSHPDPFGVDQVTLHVAVVDKLVQGLKRGEFLDQSFDRVVYIGHSLGSEIGVRLTRNSPQSIDGLILTGYSTTGSPSLIETVQFVPARSFPRFTNLNDGYLITSSYAGRRDGFYGANGTFDPLVYALDFATQDTASVGELVTQVTGPAELTSKYAGPVLVLEGLQDQVYCSGCAQGSDSVVANLKDFFPCTVDFSYILFEDVGHCINLHYRALEAFITASKWLENRGF